MTDSIKTAVENRGKMKGIWKSLFVKSSATVALLSVRFADLATVLETFHSWEQGCMMWFNLWASTHWFSFSSQGSSNASLRSLLISVVYHKWEDQTRRPVEHYRFVCSRKESLNFFFENLCMYVCSCTGVSFIAYVWWNLTIKNF